MIAIYHESYPITENEEQRYQGTSDGEGTDERSLALVGCLHDEGSLTRLSGLRKDFIILERLVR